MDSTKVIGSQDTVGPGAMEIEGTCRERRVENRENGEGISDKFLRTRSNIRLLPLAWDVKINNFSVSVLHG